MPEAGGTALITGASSGIGEAFARALAGRGVNLILVARRAHRLEKLAEELASAHHIQAEPLVADLTSERDLETVRRRLLETGNLELLVNNAGFGSRGRFWESDREAVERMHRLHVLAAVCLMRAALEVMGPKARGAIINVSSVAGFSATPGGAAYCATKAWMNTITEAVALELEAAGSPVRVQALCPGFTYTEFHDVIGADRSSIPRSWWMQADQVVAASLEGLAKGKVFVVPGLRYRLLVALAGIVPHKLRQMAVRIYARRTKRV